MKLVSGLKLALEKVASRDSNQKQADADPLSFADTDSNRVLVPKKLQLPTSTFQPPSERLIKTSGILA